MCLPPLASIQKYLLMFQTLKVLHNTLTHSDANVIDHMSTSSRSAVVLRASRATDGLGGNVQGGAFAVHPKTSPCRSEFTLPGADRDPEPFSSSLQCRVKRRGSPGAGSQTWEPQGHGRVLLLLLRSLGNSVSDKNVRNS